MGQSAQTHAPDPNGRGRKARAASRAATKLLSEAQFHRQMRVSQGAIDELHEISRGRVARNALTTIAATRTLLEWGYSKPEQRHEVTGAFTVNVMSVLPGPPGSRLREAKVAASRTLDATAVEREHANSTGDNELAVQRPIMGITETRQSVEIPTYSQDEPVYVNPLTEPSLIEAGALVASTEPNETADERRARQRREWLADPVAHPEAGE